MYCMRFVRDQCKLRRRPHRNRVVTEGDTIQLKKERSRECAREKIYLCMKVWCRYVVFSTRWHSGTFWMVKVMLWPVKAFIMSDFRLSSWPGGIMMMVSWLLNQVMLLCGSRSKNVVRVLVPTPFDLPGSFGSCKGRHSNVFLPICSPSQYWESAETSNNPGWAKK